MDDSPKPNVMNQMRRDVELQCGTEIGGFPLGRGTQRGCVGPGEADKVLLSLKAMTVFHRYEIINFLTMLKFGSQEGDVREEPSLQGSGKCSAAKSHSGRQGTTLVHTIRMNLASI